MFAGNFGLGLGLATLNAGSNDGTLISAAGSANPVIQSFATGGNSPVSGFVGDFNGFADLVVANNGDGHLALVLGGSGGLSLSQSLSNPAAPNPTSVSFGGFADNVLSFYVSTSGREAALEMAFNLDGAGAIAGPGSAPSLGPSSPGVTIVQVSQLGGSSGSVLDLIANLITLTVLPENLESELESAGSGTTLLAAFSPGGPTGSGQGLSQSSSKNDDGNGDADVKDQGSTTEPAAAGPANAAIDCLAPWARFVVGLDDAWHELRARLAESERVRVGPARNRERCSHRCATRPVPAIFRTHSQARSISAWHEIRLRFARRHQTSSSLQDEWAYDYANERSPENHAGGPHARLVPSPLALGP